MMRRETVAERSNRLLYSMKTEKTMEGQEKENAFGKLYAPKAMKQTSYVMTEETESGKGEMVCYEVAPGITISYNDLQMGSCYSPMIPDRDFLQIDHCLEGCYECESADGTVTFLGEGDLSVGSLKKGEQLIVASGIPLKRYKGITVLFDLEQAEKTLAQNFTVSSISLARIRDTLCKDGMILLVKSKNEIDHIFHELYHVDERIQTSYFWIKTIELLLFLSLLDGTTVQKPKHFTERISKKTQQIYQWVIEHPLEWKTIQELSEEYGISESSLKRCFQSVAGKTIGTFMKEKRMEAAAQILIEQSELSIGEVAYQTGYENQSKFTEAFKSVFGVTPQSYRYKNRS